jgi:pimeloyl-ACP methyl ester carboxylesterase
MKGGVRFARTVDGVDIAWQVDGDGPAVVLVHGLTEAGRLWQPVVEHLRDDFTVVRLDLRSHGDSGDAADYSTSAMSLTLQPWWTPSVPLDRLSSATLLAGTS